MPMDGNWWDAQLGLGLLCRMRVLILLLFSTTRCDPSPMLGLQEMQSFLLVGRETFRDASGKQVALTGLSCQKSFSPQAWELCDSVEESTPREVSEMVGGSRRRRIEVGVFAGDGIT
jgi:hypothetical protein